MAKYLSTKDRLKVEKAVRAGFTVFTVRSDLTVDEKQFIINKFLEKVKQNEVH